LNKNLLQSASSSDSSENNLVQKIKTALERMPKPIDADKKKCENIDKENKEPGQSSFNPQNNLIYQEMIKYNRLIEIINQDFNDYLKALQGQITMTKRIEDGIEALEHDKIPTDWLCFYLSTKSFLHFIEDLCRRVEFFRSWISEEYMKDIYMGYFTNPAAFITAIKEKFSLSSKVFFSSVSLTFKILTEKMKNQKNLNNTQSYKIVGIFIEGGQWDEKGEGLKDENVQDLHMHLPPVIITPCQSDDHNQPFENLGESSNEIMKNFPLYYLPIRMDYMGFSSYLMDIPLNIVKERDKEGNELSKEDVIGYWIKKGTCLLLSTNDV
jgi:dynein heavy chain